MGVRASDRWNSLKPSPSKTWRLHFIVSNLAKNFKNLLESLNSYILNLNRHPAYSEMRKFRAMKYKTGKKITGYDTANFLNKYAEIGFEYVTKIENMIKSNKLYRFRNAKLESY